MRLPLKLHPGILALLSEVPMGMLMTSRAQVKERLSARPVRKAYSSESCPRRGLVQSGSVLPVCQVSFQIHRRRRKRHVARTKKPLRLLTRSARTFREAGVQMIGRWLTGGGRARWPTRLKQCHQVQSSLRAPDPSEPARPEWDLVQGKHASLTSCSVRELRLRGCKK